MADQNPISSLMQPVATEAPLTSMQPQAAQQSAIAPQLEQASAISDANAALEAEKLRQQLAQQLATGAAIPQTLTPQAIAAQQIPTASSLSPVPPVGEVKDWLLTPKGGTVPITVQQPPQPEMPLFTEEDLAALPKKDLEAAVTPTMEQLMAQYRAVTEPYQKKLAENSALDNLDKLRIQHEQDQKKRLDDLKIAEEKIDARVRTKSLSEIFESGSTGSKLGAALAILVGGVSQGLTGAKTNPAVDMMDRMVEQQARKDRLSLEEKESLRKQVYEVGQLELRKLENATQNAYRKDQLSLMQQDLDLKRQKIEADLRATVAATMPKDMFSGRELKKEEILQARSNPEISDKLIILPNGKHFIAKSKEAVRQFDTTAAETMKALQQVEKYLDLGKRGNKWIGYTDKKVAESMRVAILGALRIPFTGTGPLLEAEVARLEGALGKPLSLMTWRPTELAKIDTVIDALKVDILNRARTAGVTGDIWDTVWYKMGNKAVKEDDVLEMAKRKMPNMPEDRLRLAISKTLPRL